MRPRSCECAPVRRSAQAARLRLRRAGPPSSNISTPALEAFPPIFPSGTQYASMFDMHSVSVGINRKLGSPELDAAFARGESPLAADFPNWNLHGQSTFIEQGYFHFRSPYEGANSLSGANQAKNTAS